MKLWITPEVGGKVILEESKESEESKGLDSFDSLPMFSLEIHSLLRDDISGRLSLND